MNKQTTLMFPDQGQLLKLTSGGKPPTEGILLMVQKSPTTTWDGAKTPRK